MSKKLVALIVIVLVLAGVVGAVLMSTNKDDNSKSSTATTSSGATAKKSTSSTSDSNVFSLAESGKAQKCTFSYSSTSGTGTGTMYSDGKGRGLMTINVTTSEGKTLSSNTLLLSDKVYSWTTTNGQTFGFVANKSSYSTPQSNSNNTSSSNAGSTTQNSDATKSYKVNCVGWKVDESMLAVPTNVTFQTLPGSSAQ